MHWIWLLVCLGGYVGLLLLLGWITGRKNDEQGYYLGNRKSAWYLIAFGMIADSLSGVTFMSVPGTVSKSGFSYMQVVFGYLIGYQIIALVLLPLYYRMNLTTIYSFLGHRFGTTAQRVGSGYFLLSRILGSAGRLYLAVLVLQAFFLDDLGVPLLLTSALMMGFMWLYTWKGGIKTLIYTDAVQAGMMLLAMGVAVFVLMQELDLSLWDWRGIAGESVHIPWFNTDWSHGRFWGKDLLGGAFIALCMTGLDQNMMQKNLSCKNLKEAQKNMVGFSLVIVLVNLAFLSLGALLYSYAAQKLPGQPLPEGDQLFAWLSFEHLGAVVMVFFTLGLIASTFSSADSVLATLTTSFCIDFLEFGKTERYKASERKRIRTRVQLGMALALLLSIWLFELLNERSVIGAILTLAGYTYGPLLGLFAFGIVHKQRKLPAIGLVGVCLTAPAMAWLLENYLSSTFAFSFGFAILPVNGLLTFIGLGLISWHRKAVAYDNRE